MVSIHVRLKCSDLRGGLLRARKPRAAIYRHENGMHHNNKISARSCVRARFRVLTNPSHRLCTPQAADVSCVRAVCAEKLLSAEVFSKHTCFDVHKSCHDGHDVCDEVDASAENRFALKCDVL